MFKFKDNICLRSATLDDAVYLYNNRKNNELLKYENPSFKNQSLNQIIHIIKDNKTSLSQLLIIEENNSKIGEISFFLSNKYVLFKMFLYSNQDSKEKIVKILIEFLFNDEYINELYHIEKIVVEINKEDISSQKFYTKLSFNNENIRYGIYKNDKNELQDVFEYTLFKQQYLNSLHFINKYPILLFDVDNTILDFFKAQNISLAKALTEKGINPTNEVLNLYNKINIKHWEMVERKEISREECLILRFVELFKILNVDIDPQAMENLYRKYLDESAYVIKDARLVLTTLSKNHDLYIITNGVKKTQNKRLKKANMLHFFKARFISEEIGFDKPSREFFIAMKNGIENFDNSKALIIGDSLTGDIKMGNDFNIDTCWFNPNKINNNKNVNPTYEISSLKELLMNK